MTDQPLYKQLMARYQAATEDHTHAVKLLRQRDRLIVKLHDKNTAAMRQNRRLSRESQALAQRLKELSPDDALLIDLLFPKD